ncbi:MAG: DUF3160 domain-containing protein, partial [Polyangiaceae bacterium]|nr:DUF3160 domain-containing protein [Polyangiaceae bacterium]
VSVSLNDGQQSAMDDIERERNDTSTLDAEGLLAKYPASFSTSLPYDPLQSDYLNLIESRLGPIPEESQQLLAKNGFVVRSGKTVSTYGQGYYGIFMLDLPVFISADAILEAVYRSHQAILMRYESDMLLPKIVGLLKDMRSALAAGACAGFADGTRADVDEYLAVALSLAQGSLANPVSGGDANAIDTLVNYAMSASGVANFVLFGSERTEDMSQFKPRGHYTKSKALMQYFRAMMWLGRVDLRLIETQGTGSKLFRPHAAQAMFAMRKLIGESQLVEFENIDKVLRTFISDQDNMTIAQVDDLLRDLGNPTPEAAAAMDSGSLATAIASGGYGQQQIASSIIINSTGTQLPLSASFLLMGQRFTVDSQVLSQVTWARTKEMRMMPSPLDAAFAAWGNHGAAHMLLPDLTKYSYAPNLHMARYVATNHTDSYWNSGLYHAWLGSLSGLNTSHEHLSAPKSVGLPSIAGSDAWNRRILNTQLSSWSQLRHNSVLYAKQSYADGEACDFPDAYVDPYPEFFDRLGEYAKRGLAMIEAVCGSTSSSGCSGKYHFTNLSDVSSRLGSIARDQRNGLAISAGDLLWLNKMIGIGEEYGGPGWNGWYAELFVDLENAKEFEPSITDVHTQPTDESGSPVGNVLHVGTGAPRLIIVTVDTGAANPRAFIGYVSAFHEHITSGFNRLTDEEWKGMVGSHPIPSYLSTIVGP